MFTLIEKAQAQEYNGGGLVEGLQYAMGINLPHGDLRSLILSIVAGVLGFMALVAVIVIIAAGIRLILSGGSEEAKEGSKRMILYTVIGLVVILLARMLVEFVLYALS
jgi:type IV secretory pathway VirB2 component (pilin)